MNLTVFIVIPPAVGHFNAIQSVANYLIAKGYEVWFLSSPSFRGIVEGNKFLFKALEGVPFGLGYEKSIAQQNEGLTYIQDLNLRVTDFVFNLRRSAFIDILTIKKPNIVLVDAIISTDIVVLQSIDKNIRVGIIQTMFSTAFSIDTPPLSASYLPPKNGLTNKSSLLWHKLTFKKQLQNCWPYLKYFGYSNKYIIEKHLSTALKLKHKSCFSVEFENITELILVPEELNFISSNEFYSSHYLGQNIDLNKNNPLEPKILAIVQSIQSTNQRLIYCSLGTQYDNNEAHKVADLFKKLISMFEKQNDWVAILSASFYSDFQKICDTVYLCNSLSQLKILQYADIMIGHGGLNSVKECVNFEVPMLLFPLNHKWDQPGNAARVVYHEIGLRGDIEKDTPTQINAKINELLTNPKYKTNITAMKNRIDQNPAYKPERILEIIENLPYLV